MCIRPLGSQLHWLNIKKKIKYLYKSAMCLRMKRVWLSSEQALSFIAWSQPCFTPFVLFVPTIHRREREKRVLEWHL